MVKPRLLDLFCGAGGASCGYMRAGFAVTGVDHVPQPDYCGDAFVLGDALEYLDAHGRDFDAIHAAPLWYRFARIRSSSEHPDELTPTHEQLERIGLPYVLEIGSVRSPFADQSVTLCGASLGLEIIRHMSFVANWAPLVPPCSHRHGGTTDGTYVAYGAHSRSRARYSRIVPPRRTMREWMRAAGLEWMSQKQASLASPPLYTELLGYQLRGLVGASP